jgi:thiamine biosynthesis lipoprotein
MGSAVNVRLWDGRGGGDPAHAGYAAAFAAVKGLFAKVEQQCTRFVADSALMKANAAGQEWCVVPPECYAAIRQAHRAYLETVGLFDPRVLTSLLWLGYDGSLRFGPAAAGLPVPEPPVRGEVARTPWRPEFDDAHCAVRIGADPIDLGGIGKGLSAGWAADLLSTRYSSFMLDAGGDCHLAGDGPTPPGWQVGVEDPTGQLDHVAVLSLCDLACATSSVRLRHWMAGGQEVHHLIDPRTGYSSKSGLLSVTVISDTAAHAEVWSKSLFVTGLPDIASTAAGLGLAALWVTAAGEVGISPVMTSFVIWRGR